MTFAMVVPRRPASGNKPNPLFQEHIRECAQTVFDGQSVLEGSLYARVAWFHGVPTTQDVDNIPKPIMDALKGVVFRDDFTIVQILACRVDTTRDCVISYLGRHVEAESELRRLLASDAKHVLYIEAGQAANARVSFGPIEGDME